MAEDQLGLNWQNDEVRSFGLKRWDAGKVRASAKGPKLVEVDVLAGGWTLINKDGLPGFIPEEGVQSAASAFEGKTVYAFQASDSSLFDHLGPEDKKWLAERHEIGTLRDGRVDGDAARYDLKVKDGVPESVLALIRAACEDGENPIGLSVDCGTKTRRAMRDGKLCLEMFEFGNHESGPASVDIVSNPAAKGAFRRIAASVTSQAQPETDMDKKEDVKVEPKTAPETPVIDLETVRVEREKLQAAQAGLQKLKEEADATLARVRAESSRAVAERKVAESKLTAEARESILASFKPDTIINPDDVDKAIADRRKVLASAKGDENLVVEVGAGKHDRIRLGMERLILGMAPPEWVEKAYARRMGYEKTTMSERERAAGVAREDRPHSWMDFFRTMHGEDLRVFNRHRSDPRRQKVLASVQTSSWGDVFENVNNVATAAWSEDPEFGDWRRITTQIPINNIHKQERPIVGGFANLPTVAENANYTAATEPTDQGHGWTPVKYGYTFAWTREAQLQDRPAELAKLVQKAGLAAARTLYEKVFDRLDPDDSGTMDYDSHTLFNTTHSNYNTSALTATSLDAARLAMRKQADISNSKRLGVVPRFLIVPPDLEKTAFDLLKPLANYPGGATGDNEWLRRMMLDIIVVRHWTNTGDWVLAADPNNARVETFEMGFEGGMQEPVITVQDMSNVGSVFERDAITFKVAHGFYGGDVIRHEGFYGQNV